MSDNVTGAANQQGSLLTSRQYNPSETTRRTPFSRAQIQSYFQGAIHDGTYSSNKRYRISQKGLRWLRFLQSLLTDIGYNSWIYKEGKQRDVFVLETLAPFLDFSFQPLRLKTNQEKAAYIRGFFDAEGGIPHNSKARFYIQLVQKNKKKLQHIKSMLWSLGIVCGKIHNPSVRVDPDYWRMYVLAKSHQQFIAVIGSWHPEKYIRLMKRKMI